tara:strand:+ start:510 stop:797 length:288 start_codon:yes stop_codon:yes gene_type:complete
MFLSTSLVGPWKTRSLGILSLLLGYYIGSNLTVFFFERTGNRILIVISMVILIELLIRLRSKMSLFLKPYFLILIDNIRIGSVYAVVLEAFKLGS